MSRLDRNTMQRLNQLLDSYGANPEKWPTQADRDLYELIGSSPAVMQKFEEAKALDLTLDQALDQAALHPAPAFLMSKVMQEAEASLSLPSFKEFLAGLFSPAPMGGLIAAACLGILIGSYSPEFLIQDTLQSYDTLTQSGSVSDWYGDLNNG